MILVIDDDEIMRECAVRVVRRMGREVKGFSNGIEAMQEISESGAPELVVMDVMLTGPDGFTFLNEMMSYTDTMKVPVVVVTDVALDAEDLSAYGVVGVLKKDTVTPEEIREYVGRY